MSAYPSMGEYHVPAYQLSATPFVTSSLISNGEVHYYNFSYVTRFVDVCNLGYDPAGKIAIGFTENGVLNTGNYVTLRPGASVNEEIKTTLLVVSCSSGTNISYQVFCGLTPIPARNFLVVTASNGFDGVG